MTEQIAFEKVSPTMASSLSYTGDQINVKNTRVGDSVSQNVSNTSWIQEKPPNTLENDRRNVDNTIWKDNYKISEPVNRPLNAHSNSSILNLENQCPFTRQYMKADHNSKSKEPEVKYKCTEEIEKEPYPEIYFNGRVIDFDFDPQNELHMRLARQLREAQAKQGDEGEFDINKIDHMTVVRYLRTHKKWREYIEEVCSDSFFLPYSLVGKKTALGQPEQDSVTIEPLESVLDNRPFPEVYYNGRIIDFDFDPQNELHVRLARQLREAQAKQGDEGEFDINKIDHMMVVRYLRTHKKWREYIEEVCSDSFFLPYSLVGKKTALGQPEQDSVTIEPLESVLDNRPFPEVYFNGRVIDFDFDPQSELHVRLARQLREAQAKQVDGGEIDISKISSMTIVQYLWSRKKWREYIEEVRSDGPFLPYSLVGKKTALGQSQQDSATIEPLESVLDNRPFPEVYFNGRIIDFDFDPQSELHVRLARQLREAQAKQVDGGEFDMSKISRMTILDYLWSRKK